MSRVICETAQVPRAEINRKYENSKCINGDIRVESTTQQPASILKNSNKCSGRMNDFGSIMDKDTSPKQPQVEEYISSEVPSAATATTAADCSVPLEQWTGLAQETKTRPAVDTHTVSRYSTAEWHLRNDTIAKETGEAIRNAKNIVFNAGLLNSQVYAPIDKNQVENRLRLQDKARTVFQWKVELERINTEITTEIEDIMQITQRLMRSSRAVKIIQTIDGDMKKIRNMRLEPDLVHDSLTEELNKEEALCSEIINLYNRFVDEVKMQVQELKDAKRRLECDWADKQDAHEIETACLSLKVTSPTLQWKPGCVQMPADQSTAAGYEYFVKESIALVEASIIRSRILCASVKDVIAGALKDLGAQAVAVEMALAERINVTRQACRKFERALDQCLKTLSNTETVFEKISNAVRKLDAPMKCTQTRIAMRSERKNVEHCRDTPQFGLIDEVKDIANTVSILTSQIKDAEQSIDALTKSREKIEKELMIKKKTLWVDAERCPLMRSLYPSNDCLSGYK